MATLVTFKPTDSEKLSEKEPVLKYKLLTSKAYPPTRETAGSIGYDLRSPRFARIPPKGGTYYPGSRPQKTSMPIKVTPVADRSHSGKKLDISKIKGAHLLFEMQDQHKKAWGRESEVKDQAAASHWVAGGERGSGGELPP